MILGIIGAIILIVAAFIIGALGGTYSFYKEELERTQKRIEAREEAKKVKRTSVYCGDEETAEFLINALQLLEYGAEYEIFTIDGEFHVEVKR